MRVVPALLLTSLLCATSSASLAGEFVGLRASYQHFDVGTVAKSTLLDGGNLLNVVQDEVASALSIGGEYLNINERYIYSLSLDYGSTRTLGQPIRGFSYRLTDRFGEVTESYAAVASQSARMTLGAGYNVIRWAKAFCYVSPALTLEYGTDVTLDEAAEQFVRSGLQASPQLAVHSRLQAGLKIRLFTGFSIREGLSLAASPSWRLGGGMHQRANADGLRESGVRAHRPAFGLAVGLYRAIAP